MKILTQNLIHDRTLNAEPVIPTLERGSYDMPLVTQFPEVDITGDLAITCVDIMIG